MQGAGGEKKNDETKPIARELVDWVGLAGCHECPKGAPLQKQNGRLGVARVVRWLQGSTRFGERRPESPVSDCRGEGDFPRAAVTQNPIPLDAYTPPQPFKPLKNFVAGVDPNRSGVAVQIPVQ